MSKSYTLWDPNLGNVPLAVAIAGTPFNPNPLVDATLTDPVITGGTMDNTEIGNSTPAKAAFETTQVGALTATQLASLGAGLSVTGNTVLHTTQVDGLTATNVSLSTLQVGTLTAQTTVTINGTALISVQVGTITSKSFFLFGLRTVGGTVGATPHVATVNTSTGKVTVAGTAGDTSTYNIAKMC